MAQYSGGTSFLFGANETYIAEMYDRYLNDPASVDIGWAEYFGNLKEEGQTLFNDSRGASWAHGKHRL